MSDLKMTLDDDIAIEGADFAFVYDADAIRQDASISSRVWLGETPYDLAVGIPYETVIFVKGVPEYVVDAVFEDHLSRRPGVISAIAESTIAANRKCSVRAQIDTRDFGAIPTELQLT